MSGPPPHRSSTHGVRVIAAERRRQIDVELYDMDHDQHHADNELIAAASCYLLNARYMTHGDTGIPENVLTGLWPWEPNDWKPSGDPMRDLAKAGALVAAEIDRLNYKRLLDAQQGTEDDDDAGD